MDVGTFWANSRYAGLVPGVDLRPLVMAALDGMANDGRWFELLAAVCDGNVLGTAVVFKDPWYRSNKRDDVACLGLVTAQDATELEVLLDGGAEYGPEP